MTRFGKILAALLALVVVVLALVIRINPSPPAATPTAEVLPSGLVVPVAGIRPAQLADSFGDARGGGARAHGALDIMAPRGTPVLAAAAGTIEKLFESELGGHTIYLRSPDGRWSYYYAHLDGYAPDLREGRAVTRGEAIGSVGSTGDASAEAPHLHFEIHRMDPRAPWYRAGPGINPFPLLRGG